jgi:glucosamine--fructose-6-phosphate aminotransferase (isomerizing)
VSAILAHTRQVVYLDDGEMAVLDRNGYRIIDLNATESQQEGRADRLGPRADRARRLRALHAQGDLRAAARRWRTPMRGRLLLDEGTSKLGG